MTELVEDLVAGNAPLRAVCRDPGIRLGSWPTPVTQVRNPAGHDVLVKRDDLSQHGRGGVKTRKIEHVVAHLLEKGHHAFVTAVGNVTNLAHDIVPVLREHGLDWSIVIADDPPLPVAERRRLFADLDGDVRLVGPNRPAAATELGRAFALHRGEGRRPYLALPSLSQPIGVAATAKGFVEMVGQVERMDVAPLQTVFITASSGTTLAGFIFAERLLRAAGHRPIHVVGVQVYPGPIDRIVHGLVWWTERAFGVQHHVRFGDVDLRTNSLAGGFGRFTPSLVDLCSEVHAGTGMTIDPVFGAKTWSAMDNHLAQGAWHGSVLYWHCGFTPDWERLDPFVNR